MMLIHNSATILATSLAVTSAYKPCPPLGPVFQAPTSLCTDDIFQAALKNLTSILDNATATDASSYGPLAASGNSFSIGIYNADETLFSYQWTAPPLRNSSQGVKEVTDTSVYRIGSGSKLITAYMFLIEAGAKYWSHPITEFLPELADAARNHSASLDPVDFIDWSSITVGALASHLAGIPRDYSTPAELLTSTFPLAQYGAPTLPSSAFPLCGYNFTNGCSKEQYLTGINAEHPVFAPYTTPVYSNGGYEILGFIIEAITNTTSAKLFEKDFIGKLGMTGSSYFIPKNLSNAVMPGGPIASYFVADTGLATADGGYYSTQVDLIKMGQSILGATLLSPVQIRQWMKPDSFSSDPTTFVGKPWEIHRATELTDHVVDIYTKSGDLFVYSTNQAFITDYGVGFVILAAGSSTTKTVEIISDMIAATMIPALEDAARAQSEQNIGGSYASSNATAPSNITIATNAGEAGLVITEWFSNGVDFLPVIASIYVNATEADVRLYPTNLVQQVTPTRQRIAYRMVVEAGVETSDGGVFSADCITWFIEDARKYGNVGLDDFVVEFENGKAVSISPRALRITLAKES